jgi:inorganic triphosphatase YgiF
LRVQLAADRARQLSDRPQRAQQHLNERACNDTTKSLDEIWGPARQAAIHAALTKAQPAVAEQAWARIWNHVNHYLTTWKSERAEACRTQPVTRRGTRATMLERRLHCLDNQLPANCTRFARVRTLVSEVALINQARMTY